MADGADGNGAGGDNARKRRKRRHRDIERAQKAREDAQVGGRDPTVPEGAHRSEVVDPATQGEQSLPGITARAIEGARTGRWNVPPDMVPRCVDEMVSTVITSENEAVKVMAFNALTKAEQMQWERDYPELAGKAKGGGVNVGVGVQVQQGVVGWDAVTGAAPIDDPVEKAMQEVKAGAVQNGKAGSNGCINGKAQREDAE